MTGLDERTVDWLKSLARRINRIERDIRDQGRQSSAAFQSVENSDGGVSYYDEDGTERLVIGTQDDDRFSIKHKGGAAPPQPTTPDCSPVTAGVLVAYDGTFEAEEATPSDLDHFEIHASTTSVFTADDTTLVGTIFGDDGGTFVHGVITHHQPLYYAIVAVDHAGNTSTQSDSTAAKSGGYRGYQDSISASGPGTNVIHLTYQPVPDSTIHLYWNGIEQPDSVWSVSGYTLTIVDPASLIVAGDLLLVKYLYEDPTPRPVASNLTLHGGVGYTAAASTCALPTGTQVGDFIVVMISDRYGGNISVTDSRLTLVYTESGGGGGPGAMYTGFATTLAPLAISLGGIWTAVAIAAYAETVTVAHVSHSNVAGATTLPTVSDNVAVLGYAGSAAFVALGSPTIPSTTYSGVEAQAVTSFAIAEIRHWHGTGPSPASGSTNLGNVQNLFVAAGVV